MATDPPSPISSSYQTANNSFSNNNRMHSPNYQRQRTPATTTTTTTPSTESLTSNGYRPLNVKDALTYLDQVKVKFSDQPEVYNRFLDIMKEFKSQAIDTPGVIERVSTLFRGHPALISGFNTFLPPGYRIECSTDDHARDIIRVTTPTGTTTTSTTEPMLNLQDSSQVDQSRYYQPYPTTPTANTIASSSNAYRNTPPTGPLPSISSYHHPSMHQQPVPVPPPPPPPQPQPHHHHHHHQQQQQHRHPSTAAAVSQQHAYHPTTTTTNTTTNTPTTNTSGPPPPPPSQAQSSHALSPHAPSTSNTVSSNVHPSHHQPLSAHPSTPSSHLPSSSSQSRAMVDESATRRAPVEFNHAINYVNKIKNRFSNDPETYKQFLEILQTYQKEQKPIQEVYAQVQVLFNGANDLLGEFKQFLPDTSSNQEVTIKKKRNLSTPLKSASKRSKISKNMMEDDVSDVRSSLLRITPEEQDFFDRIRKNTTQYNTFLKLLSLYSQQILDANTLIEKSEPLIKKQELLNTLKKMVGYKSQDQIIENIPQTNVPNFSKCKEYGPSYRLVPKSWRNQQCSGRDSLCWEVLNDDYVSHPNYNDEYICSNKKNQYEEALHRVEDERYEYDINIEANLNTISLLEPVSKKLQNMSEEDKANFRLPPGLGGPSKTIYQRIIKKIYGKSKANDVIEMLHSHPSQAVPIVLKRLKQKDEEWKKAQREWNKVWREIEIKNYYRSLDYQGVIFKVNDRKKMTVKSLVTEIEALHTDDQRPQFHFNFTDKTLFKDVTRLLFSFFDRQDNLDDAELMKAFIEMFLPVLFDVPDVLPTQDNELEESVDEEEEEEEEEEDLQSQHSYDSEFSSTRRASPRRGRRSPRHHKMMNEDEQPLLKDVLTRSIKNTTPPDEEMEEENNDGDDEAEEEIQQEVPVKEEKEEEEEMMEQAKEQKIHRFFGNTAFYCFFRLLQMAYERLGKIKSFDQNNKPNAEKAKELNKTATELNLSSRNMYSLSLDFKSGYYKPMLKLIDRFFDGDVDQHVFEECARYIYGNQAYLMFTIDKLMASITKQLHSIVTEPKAQELLSLYKKNHQLDSNTPELTRAYRQEVSEILNTDDGLYSITFDTLNRILSIQILSNEDETFEFNNDDDYHNYVTSYTDWEQHTLGVNQNQLSPILLKRNLKQHTNKYYYSKTQMQYKICKNTYHLFYMMDTEDALIRHHKTATTDNLLFKKDWLDIKDKNQLEKEARALLG